MRTLLEKIALALDSIADDLDAKPVELITSELQPKVASSADLFREVFKQHTGEDPPSVLVEKLSGAEEPEVQAALSKLLKTSALDRPTPLGAPSEDRAQNVAPSNPEAMKIAWDAFEETIFQLGND